MNILNTTTNEIETIYYAPTGYDCLADLIEGSLIQYNRAEDRHEAPATEIEFWLNWISAAEKADEMEAELAEKLGDKMAASEVSIEAVSGVEFNDQPAARIEALQEALNAWPSPIQSAPLERGAMATLKTNQPPHHENHC